MSYVVFILWLKSAYVLCSDIFCIFVIQESTSHHTSEAVDVYKLLTRGLILTVGPAIVVGVKASLLAVFWDSAYLTRAELLLRWLHNVARLD